MTVSSVDTAELPRVRGQGAAPPAHSRRLPEADLAPAAPLVAPPTAPPAPILRPQVPGAVPIACRAALRAERLHKRRQRRLYASVGLSLLGVTLGCTVFVLDAVH